MGAVAAFLGVGGDDASMPFAFIIGDECIMAGEPCIMPGDWCIIAGLACIEGGLCVSEAMSERGVFGRRIPPRATGGGEEELDEVPSRDGSIEKA